MQGREGAAPGCLRVHFCMSPLAGDAPRGPCKKGIARERDPTKRNEPGMGRARGCSSCGLDYWQVTPTALNAATTSLRE